jgi:hypothetical protein
MFLYFSIDIKGAWPLTIPHRCGPQLLKDLIHALRADIDFAQKSAIFKSDHTSEEMIDLGDSVLRMTAW